MQIELECHTVVFVLSGDGILGVITPEAGRQRVTLPIVYGQTVALRAEKPYLLHGVDWEEEDEDGYAW